MRNAKKGILNSLYGVIGQLVLTAVAFFLPKLVIENYGSETNGLLHSTAQIISYLSLFEAGVGAATIQALYSPVARNERERISAIMSATDQYYRKTGVIYAIGVVLIALIYPIAIHTELPYGLAMGVILFSGIGGCLSFFYQGKYMLLMRAEGYSYVIEKIDITTNIILNIVKFVLLKFSTNVLIIQISIFLVSILKCVIYSAFIRKKYAWINLKAPPDNAAISQKNAVLVHQISSLVFSSTDVVLLTILLQDLKAVSVYTLYYAIVYAVYGVIQKLTAGFDFKLGQLYNTNKEKYCKAYHLVEMVDMISIFSTMSALYIILLPLISLYTRKITDTVYIIQWLPLLFVTVPLLAHGRQATFSTLAYSGHYKQTRKHTIIESIINIAVSIPCILLIGIPGALVGTIVATIYRTITAVNYSYKYLLSEGKEKTIKRWLLCITVFAVTVAVNYFVPLPYMDSFVLIGFVAVGFTIIFAMIYFIGQYIINKDERETIKRIIKTRNIKSIFTEE